MLKGLCVVRRTGYAPVLPLFPELHICRGETVGSCLFSILPSTKASLTLPFALHLNAVGCLITADAVYITRTRCSPTVPSDVVSVTLWAFRKFREIKRMYDGEWFEIC